MGESREKLLWSRGKVAGAEEQRGLLKELPLPFPLGRWEVEERWVTGTVPAPSLVLWVPQPFQHPVAVGTFRLTHGMETLVWAVSKRVTLVTSAWDMQEVGKSPGTSAITYAQPLALQRAQARGVQAGSVTPSPACDTVPCFREG